MRGAFLISLIAFAAPAGGDSDSGAGIECVMRELASISGLQAKFREEKRLILLKEPLVSEGSLFYAAPDSLLRRVDAPIPSRVLVRGDELIVEGPDGGRSMRLSENPVLRVFIDTFRLLLAGALPELRRIHEVDFESPSGSCEDWTLRLRPLQTGPIAEIHAAGSGRVVRELSIHDRAGNQTTMHFSQVDPARRFGDEERARLFAVSPP